MDDLPRNVKLARMALKVIFVPTVVLAVAVRFTLPSYYWIDLLFIALLLVAAVLAVVGRVFTSKKQSGSE